VLATYPSGSSKFKVKDRQKNLTSSRRSVQAVHDRAVIVSRGRVLAQRTGGGDDFHDFADHKN
jgi:hypothetical protein